MKTLFFQLESPYHFFVIEKEKGILDSILMDAGEYADLETIAEQSSQFEQCIAIVPGEAVSIFDVNLPIRSRKKALQAIPFALEEQVADNIDELHFTLLEWQPGGTSTVGVIKRDFWYRYVLWMEENNVEIHQILPDFALLPLQIDEDAFIFVEPETERALLKFRQGGLIKGMSLMLDELPFWIDEFEAQGKTLLYNDPRVLTLLEESREQEEVTATIKQVTLQNYSELCMQYPSSQEGSLQLYASDQTQRTVEKSKPWVLVAAAFLIISLLVNIGIDVFEYRVLKLQENALNQRVEEIFKQSFPRVDRIVDARLQFQRELDALKGNTRGSQEFLFLLDSVINSVPKKIVRVEEVFYRNSALNVILKADGFEVLDQFTNRLGQNKSVSYERVSSDSQGGKVTARYRLSTIKK